MSLPRLVEQLVGKEGVSLKLENPEKYHFDPDKLLSLLVKVILVFSESSQFILCMNEEGTPEATVDAKEATAQPTPPVTPSVISSVTPSVTTMPPEAYCLRPRETVIGVARRVRSRQRPDE